MKGHLFSFLLKVKVYAHEVILLSVRFVLSLLSEERCRLCHRLLGITHLLFKMNSEEREQAKPAILWDHRSSGGSVRRSTVLCQACFSELIEQAVPAYGFPDFQVADAIEVASGGVYTGALRELIHKFKFSADRALLPDLVAVILRADLKRIITSNEKKGQWIVTSVPLHWRKKNERGFNQAELIARSISKRLELPYCGRAIKRVRRTTPQRELGHDAREQNVAGAFTANPKVVRDRCFLLVDDICTSGATLTACAKALKEAGAVRVVAATIAKAAMYSQSAQIYAVKGSQDHAETLSAFSSEFYSPRYNDENPDRGDPCPSNTS